MELYLFLVFFVFSFYSSFGLDCSKSVALEGSGLTNLDCFNLCTINDSSFDSKCGKVDWYFDNKNVKSDDCYAMHIYGYVGYSGSTDEGTRAGYKSFKNVTSPQDCQEFCQNDSDCVNWIWSDPSSASSKPNCVLKSQTYIDHAWLGSGSWNNDWCNPTQSTACYLIELYECVGENTCIWCSHQWLSGPKFCLKGGDGPQAGPDGFPICDGIPDIHVTTTQDPTGEPKPTRPPTASTYPPITTTTTTTLAPITTTTLAPVTTTTTTSVPIATTTTTTTSNSDGTGIESTTTISQTTTTTTGTPPAGVPPAVIAGAAGGAIVAAMLLGGAGYFYFDKSTPPVPQPSGHFEGDEGNVDQRDKEQATMIGDDDFEV